MFQVQVMESVDSTNEVVKRAIEAGKPEGYAVRAFEQTGGYGRQGRAWQSPKGGMYESVLLRPNVEVQKLPTLALVAALAVRRALSGLVAPESARRIKVKWPNDVVLADDGEKTVLSPRAGAPAPCASTRLRYAKLCGISSEVHAGGVCIGIGVNVVPGGEGAPVGGKNAPAYLSELGLQCNGEIEATVNRVGDAVLFELAGLYARWCAEGFSSLSGEFAECSMLAGRFVRMADLSGNVVHEGVAVGIDGDGRLLLEARDGSIVPVMSGEVHLV